MADTGPLGDSRVVTQQQGGGEQFSQTLGTQGQQGHRQASDFSGFLRATIASLQVVSSLPATQPPLYPVLLRTGPAFFVMNIAADGVQSRISGVTDSWGRRLGVESLAETRGGSGNGTKNS